MSSGMDFVMASGSDRVSVGDGQVERGTYRKFVNIVKNETVVTVTWDGMNVQAFRLFCVAAMTTPRRNPLHIHTRFSIRDLDDCPTVRGFFSETAYGNPVSVRFARGYYNNGEQIKHLVHARRNRAYEEHPQYIQTKTVHPTMEGALLIQSAPVAYAQYDTKGNDKANYDMVDYDLLCRSALRTAQGFKFHPDAYMSILCIPALCAFLEHPRKESLHVYSPRELDGFELYMVNVGVKSGQVTWVSCEKGDGVDFRHYELASCPGLAYLNLDWKSHDGMYNLLEKATENPTLEVVRLSNQSPYWDKDLPDHIWKLIQRPRMRHLSIRSNVTRSNDIGRRDQGSSLVEFMTKLVGMRRNNPVVVELNIPMIADPFLHYIREAVAALRMDMYTKPNEEHMELVRGHFRRAVDEANRRLGFVTQTQLPTDRDVTVPDFRESDKRGRWEDAVLYGYHVFRMSLQIYGDYRERMIKKESKPLDSRAVFVFMFLDLARGIVAAMGAKLEEDSLQEEAMAYYLYTGYRMALDLDLKELQGLPDDDDPNVRAFKVLQGDNGKEKARLIHSISNRLIQSFLPPSDL